MSSRSKEVITNKKLAALEKEIVRLERLAYKDVLVDAYNRRGFLKFSWVPFSMAVQARNYNRRGTDKARDLCLVLIDIDNFKHYNDRYSYAIGDYVLKTVAAYFNHNIRKTDVFGRWGGDEFVILLPFTKIEAAKKLAEHHIANFTQTTLDTLKTKKMKAHIKKWSEREAVTFSIGIASLNKEKTIQALVSKANKVLKLAKTQKNAIVIANK